MAAGLVGALALTWLVQFVRRPLGGNPDKPPIDDSDFRDDKNPYRS